MVRSAPQSALAPRLPGLSAPADAGLRETLREYYGHRSVRNRMREFLGVSKQRDATAMYIAATDGRWDQLKAEPPSALAKCLDAHFEVDRSLWDSQSLLADLDMEYTNFDHPEAAWLDPQRTFEVQEPVIDATLQTLAQTGIEPLVLVTGRGFHLVWSVGRESAVFQHLAHIGHVNGSLLARYAQIRSPSGAAITPELGHAYAGLGMIVEFIAHRVLARTETVSPIPVELTAIEVGPGPHGREIVSFDISEYGDPLHMRHIRLPFSAYLKPRCFEWRVEPHPKVLPIFEIPLDRLSLREAIGVARSPDAAVRLSRNIHAFVPDCSAPMQGLVDEYESSDLAAFHRDFYQERSPISGITFTVRDAPPCLNWLLENPNDWLLRPAALQHVSRILMALQWDPRAIAGLIAARYEKDLDWGDQWIRLDPFNRAMFYTRLFCGVVATGLDRLIDLNCVSHREKGYCMSSHCRANLVEYRDRLRERRRGN